MVNLVRRFVLAANAIVALYSLLEMGAAIWEILRGTTPLPEALQLWLDFSHDQVLAYLLLSAEASGTGEARNLRRGDTCAAEDAFCVQAYISVALGFGGFMFLAASALISGYRLLSYFITGSRFHV
ncbi:uncharacterized protein A4U43_C07F2320 [Asparagus officinalis]|uniref:CASP-like protein n=1 Tax=Asparagus officinalis TaxID=4686 RepID=A0A5P1E8Y5_ASPOF|nr:CASP-like protein 4C1 [Asparagus officinalis]ONK62284.1 uncharacterized protein A4U43_C07F2320 [Asparagus officinalis]